MELAIALLILVALGFLYYGWIRLRQEAEAKARQLIFRKSGSSELSVGGGI